MSSLFFFFKQKTAYEMRISDWSSDVCSSDLAGAARIVAVDVVDDKLALARQLGATDTFNAAEEGAVEAICAATGGGVDYAFEMAGSVKAMDLCYRSEERRVGKEWVRTGRSGWWPHH